MNELASRLVPEVRKIAVLRANALGDFIFALPALEALRAAYPEAEIVLLGKAWHAAFLAGRPGPIDRVVVVPPTRGVNGEQWQTEDSAQVATFFKAMKRERFDLALQMHGGGRYSNPFTRRLGACITAGPGSTDAERLDRPMPYIFFQPEIARWLEVVGLVGATPIALQPRLAVTAHDHAEADAAVPPDGRPLAILHPGASDPRRRWPAKQFAAVGDGLARAGARVLITGVAAEADVVRQLCTAMRHPAVNLAGQISLHALTGLLARSAVVVSNDSGPLHLASAVGARSVGLYWCFNLCNCSVLTRGRHRPIVSWRMNCPRCGASAINLRCGHTDSFIADIPAEEVRDAALEWLAVATREKPFRPRGDACTISR